MMSVSDAPESLLSSLLSASFPNEGSTTASAIKAEHCYSYAKQIESLTKGFENFVQGIQVADQLKESRNPNESSVDLDDANEQINESGVAGAKGTPIQSTSNNGVECEKCPTCFRTTAAVNDEVMNMQIKSICAFLQILFANQMEMLGKNYQIQMEVTKKVEELQARIEEDLDEELEAIVKDLSTLKNWTLKKLQIQIEMVNMRLEAQRAKDGGTSSEIQQIHATISKLVTCLESLTKRIQPSAANVKSESEGANKQS